MTTWEELWGELYATQTETLRDPATGADGLMTATVDGTEGRCIIGIDGRTPQLQLSAFIETGSFSFQMLASTFENSPLPQCPVSIGDVTGLYLANVNWNNGVGYFTAQDPNKQ